MLFGHRFQLSDQSCERSALGASYGSHSVPLIDCGGHGDKGARGWDMTPRVVTV